MCLGFNKFSMTLVLAVILTFLSATSYAKEEAKPAEPAKASGEDWTKVQAEVAALKAKIAQSEETLKKLNEDRLKAKDEQTRADLRQSMKTEHQNLKGLIKDYEERRNYFLYRFPEKGKTTAREYHRIELKSLEEIENQHTLESKVSKAVKTMRGQFKSQLPKTKEKKDQKESDLSAPIILSK